MCCFDLLLYHWLIQSGEAYHRCRQWWQRSVGWLIVDGRRRVSHTFWYCCICDCMYSMLVEGDRQMILNLFCIIVIIPLSILHETVYHRAALLAEGPFGIKSMRSRMKQLKEDDLISSQFDISSSMDSPDPLLTFLDRILFSFSATLERWNARRRVARSSPSSLASALSHIRAKTQHMLY